MHYIEGVEGVEQVTDDELEAISNAQLEKLESSLGKKEE